MVELGRDSRNATHKSKRAVLDERLPDQHFAPGSPSSGFAHRNQDCTSTHLPKSAALTSRIMPREFSVNRVAE